MDQASQISKSVAGSTLMSQWGGDKGVRKLPAGHIAQHDKTLQNLVQDAVASKEAIKTTAETRETPDITTKTVVMHTKAPVQSEPVGHAGHAGYVESSDHIDKTKTVQNIPQGQGESVASKDKTEITTKETSVQLDDKVISIFFKILLWRVIIEDKNHYFENPQNKNVGSRGGVLSEEANKLLEKMNFTPKVKDSVLAEIKEYTRNPHRIDHPVFAAVCANCPKLLKMFIASVDKSNEAAIAYTLDRTGQNDTATPLIMAVGMRNMKFMKQLLRAGAKPDPVHPPKDKTTALMVAMVTQNTRMVERLMAHGAKLDPVGPQGTVIDIARSCGYHDQDIEDIEKYLRTQGTQPSALTNALPSKPIAPEPADAYKAIRKIDVQLMSAVCAKNKKHIEKLIKKGANPNVAFPSYDPEIGDFGYTALYCAIRHWQRKEDMADINKLRVNGEINNRDHILVILAMAATLSLSQTAQFVPTRKKIVQDAKKKLDAWGVKIPSEIKKVLTDKGYLEIEETS